MGRYTGEHTIQGTITSIGKSETINFSKGSFERQTFILNTKTKSFEFEHEYQFEITGQEKLDMLADKLVEQSEVRITFYIKSRQWNDKFYYSLVPKDIVSLLSETMESAAGVAAEQYDEPDTSDDDGRKLPF